MTVTQRRRRTVFALCSTLAIAAIVADVQLTRTALPGSAATVPAGAATAFVDSVPAGPLLMFRSTGPGALFGRIAVVTLPVTSSARAFAPLSCERLHYAASHGVCLTTDETRSPVRYVAYTFDASFRRQHAIDLTGPPVRARVSPDGRRAAVTVFEQGHSYADAAFSTRTLILDTGTGTPLADLEEFAIDKDGVRFSAVDFNFWGVTFARDGDTFFATLKTGGERYLVKGSVDARRASVVRAGVECPSLSPDGTLLVFKKPLTSAVGWQLQVLDLASGTEHALNQRSRSVDDQVDWFDDRHVVYFDSGPDGSGVWVLAVDGGTPPRLLVADAYSPVVLR